MLHESDTAVCERLGILFWPDGVLALFEDWASVLDYEFQFRVESAELDVETAYICDQHKLILILLRAKVLLTHSTADIHYRRFAKLIPWVV